VQVTKDDKRGEEWNGQEIKEAVCGSGFAGWKFVFMVRLVDLAGPH